MKLFGSVTSFVKLAPACLMLLFRRRGAVPVVHPYAFMACTGTAVTQMKLALLLTKCPVSLMRSPVWQ